MVAKNHSNGASRRRFSERLQAFSTDSAKERFLREQALLPALPALQGLGFSVPAVAVPDPAPMDAQASAECQVLERLVAAGVEFSLAGASLAAWTLYRIPSQRQRRDVLLLMPLSSCRLSQTVLSDLGFRVARRQSAITREEVWCHSSSDTPVRPVLRWGLCDHPLLSRRFSISGALAHSGPLDGPIDGLRGLDRVYSVLYMALQYFDRWAARPLLIDLLDQDLAWRALTEEDRQVLLQLARQRGVAGLVEAHLRVVRDVFGTPVPNEMLNSLAQSARHERTTRLIGATGSRFRYHWLAASSAQGLRPRWRHLITALRG
ncbi:MAG: hypothetical protein EA370_10240 [Wenzhouxiangella sp.]|nr:MAG: hypothetical protein EA370_10240 [Wenzhouxiangella sp.]